MRISVHALDRIGCEGAERRHGSRNAESEEAQIALGEYSRGDLKSCGNDKGADAVCEQVLSDYARAACAESARAVTYSDSLSTRICERVIRAMPTQ